MTDTKRYELQKLTPTSWSVSVDGVPTTAVITKKENAEKFAPWGLVYPLMITEVNGYGFHKQGDAAQYVVNEYDRQNDEVLRAGLVACPYCRQPARHVCKDNKGKTLPLKPHKARIKEARRGMYV